MKKNWHHTLILSGVFTLLVSFAAAQNGIIKGTVKGGGNVLPAATVSLGNKTITTDSNGEFYLSIKPGNYTLIITYTGYDKIVQSVNVISVNTQIFAFSMTPNDQLGEVVVSGSRSSIQRTNLNTPVPVDVFSANKLVEARQQGLIQMLNYRIPSFNANPQVLSEPVTLRGLDPDHVLVLVNGIRYHNTAWMNNGTPASNLGRGSVGNDLNSIPFSAVEKVEILRHGASAQYGSDAIAGVINILLKDSAGKTSIQLHTGQFYAGDGLKLSFGFNQGIRLGKTLPAGRQGFLNYLADLRHQGATSRGGEYKGTVYKDYPPGSTGADSAIIKAQDDSWRFISRVRMLRRSLHGLA